MSHALRRYGAAVAATRSFMTVTPVVGWPVARLISSRIVAAAAADGERVRTSHADGTDPTIEAFNPSDVCDSGMYSVGCGSRKVPSVHTGPTTPTICRCGSPAVS